MRKPNRRSIDEKTHSRNWRRTVPFLMLFGILFAAGINVRVQAAPCDVVAAQVVTQVSVPFTVPQTGAWGYSNFDIRRNGEHDHYVQIFIDVPDDTVFKAYFNGAQVGTLQRFVSSRVGEYWELDANATPFSIAHPGDVMSVTKNDQPFVSGTYARAPLDYEAADASTANPGSPLCTTYRARVSLPTSSTPRNLRSAFLWAVTPAPNPATRITINEPGITPGILGTQIAELPIVSSNTTGSWIINQIAQTDTALTEAQFTMLRQGLITITVYNVAHPKGYSTMTIHTQGINVGSDFEGDGIADLAVFRPSETAWYIKLSSSNLVERMIVGHASDKLVVGDYDTDRKADVATFQGDDSNYPGMGVWQILNSSDEGFRTIPWGLNTDVPVPMNIDTNNTTDLGVFRPATGMWYIKRMGDIIKPLAKSSNSSKSVAPENNGPEYYAVRWGMSGDIPLAGDFDNDTIDELVVFRPSEGNWYIYNIAKNSYEFFHWGANGDIPMAKDFDGDHRADLAVYRPSTGGWYIYGSLEKNLIIRNLGINGDKPVPADFDQDGVADVAVFRPRMGMWYIFGSSNNSYYSTRFGQNGDIPAATP